MRKTTLFLTLAAVAATGYFGYSQFIATQNQLPDYIAYGNGQIEATQVDIAARTGGRVAEVLVREGDMVQPGDVLVQLDTAQLEAQLARAEADVAAAESEVSSATATIAQNEARLLFSQQALERAIELLDRQIGTQEELDARRSEYDVAIANLEASRANEVARQRRVDAARASVREIETQIEDAELLATATGRVLYRLAEPGEVVGSGGKVLTILDLENVYMEFFLPATQAHLVELGSEARIKLDILDFAAPATVTFVSPQSQFSPRSVEIQDERERLMFRTRVRVPQELVQANIESVMTGIRGVAYVKLQPDGADQPWPENLQPPQFLMDAIQANVQ